MVVVVTAEEMMRIGLELGGFDVRRQNRVRSERSELNVRRFKALFGSRPIVYAQIWEDLQTTRIRKARIDGNVCVNSFLMAIHFLKRYPTEEVLSGLFKFCERTVRKWVWYYVSKIKALKKAKIVWPTHWGDDDFIISVDGVHCRINEPKDPTMSKNPKYYSHKFKQAALTYELGISLSENKLVWMKGPFEAGKHDVTVFRDEGLWDKIPDGKFAIGDRGYLPKKEEIEKRETKKTSTPNTHDPRELRKFKSRARARQESFNAKIKNFVVLDVRFRHGIKKHQTVFEAICVIVQYQLENGSPLFNA
jgi:hypothetical protein